MLIRRTGERAWHAPAGTTYTDEASLEALLEESPWLLPGPDEDKPLVVVRQLSVATGSVDLFGVSRSGAITIVECKLQANPEIRRSVVGQVFAYAAGLWGLSLEELDRSFQIRSKTPLVDSVRAALREDESNWDESSFRNAVAENLAEGRFRLVLAVDSITPELKRIVEYLNYHSVPDVLVIALELAYFTSDGVEVLKPQLYGQEFSRAETGGRTSTVGRAFVHGGIVWTGRGASGHARGPGLGRQPRSTFVVWARSGKRLGLSNHRCGRPLVSALLPVDDCFGAIAIWDVEVETAVRPQ